MNIFSKHQLWPNFNLFCIEKKIRSSAGSVSEWNVFLDLALQEKNINTNCNNNSTKTLSNNKDI